MNIPIVLYGSSILRKKTVKVTMDDIPQLFVEDLYETLKKTNGLGLAGPQIGLLKRVFVISTPLRAEEENSAEIVEQAFINPEITWRSHEMNFYNEGCLSIPGIYECVHRPGIIRVRYNDLSFNVIEEELTGIVARVFQHEYDHLDGILFIDKIDILNRKLLSGKLKRIAKLSKL